MQLALSGFYAFGGPDERNLVSYFPGVQHGMKELGCNTDLRKCMWGQSTVTRFNEIYCLFLWASNRNNEGGADPFGGQLRVFPEVKVSEPLICSSLPCPSSEKRTGTKLYINLCCDYVKFMRKECDNIIIQRCYQYFSFNKHTGRKFTFS